MIRGLSLAWQARLAATLAPSVLPNPLISRWSFGGKGTEMPRKGR